MIKFDEQAVDVVGIGGVADPEQFLSVVKEQNAAVVVLSTLLKPTMSIIGTGIEIFHQNGMTTKNCEWRFDVR